MSVWGVMDHEVMSTPGEALDEAVGAELRAMRARRQLSRPALAALSGVAKTTIGRLESGARTASVRQLAALCAALNVGVGVLIARAEAEVVRTPGLESGTNAAAGRRSSN